MKNKLFSIIFALVAFAATAQTVSITSTSLELIGASAATRTLYDLDNTFITYKAGKVVVYENATLNQLFSGDTSEVSVTSATHWGAKAAKLARWYQSAGTTTGFRYFIPRRLTNYVYNGSTHATKVVDALTKKVLVNTHVDSIHVSGVSGVSSKLTWLRNQAFLEGARNNYGFPDLATIATGSAAGTGATATLVGNGQGWTVTLTTGTTATNSGVLFTLTLPTTFPTGCVPDVDAGDPDAASHRVRYFTTATASTIVLNATGTALTDATAYVFHVKGTGY
jgi:hypothetical protein